ncbi:MAG: hypothetical protein ACERLB_10540 [Gammaproteobacteria bacterium]
MADFAKAKVRDGLQHMQMGYSARFGFFKAGPWKVINDAAIS